MKKYLRSFTALFLVSCLTFALCACGEEQTSDTSETPPITAAPVKEETASVPDAPDETASSVVTIRSESDGTFTSATVKRSGDDVEEQADVSSLPFSVNIKYFLNDEEVTAEEIAGASGDVRIRFEYKNNTSVKETVEGTALDTKVPLVFFSLVMLPEERFANIEVENGSVTEFSGNRCVMGFAVPGLDTLIDKDAVKDELDDLKEAMEDEDPSDENDTEETSDLFNDYIEITARANSFKLDFTTTMVMNGLLKDDEKEDRFADFAETLSKMEKFNESGEDLVDGCDELNEGVTELVDGVNEYINAAADISSGAAALADGAASLESGAWSLNDGAAAVNSGAASVYSGASALTEGSGALVEGISQTGSGISALNEQSEALISGAADLASDINALIELAGDNEELKAALTALYEGAEALSGGVAAYTGAVAALGEGMSAISTGAGTLNDGISALTEGASQLYAGTQQLAGGTSSLASGASALSDGAGTLSSGCAEYVSAGSELSEGLAEFQDGITEFTDKLAELNDKLFKKLASLADGALYDTIRNLRALEKADRDFLFEGTNGDVMFIIETKEIR